MSKSGDEVKETAYEKELAKTYSEQWAYFQDNIVPVQAKVIEDAKGSNDKSVYDEASKDVNLGYEKSFTEAKAQTLGDMTSSGINPGSKKFTKTLGSMENAKASTLADAETRTEVAVQERYADKLGNVMAMGQGEAQQSVATLNDIADNSQRKAVNDASINAQENRNTLNAVGMVAGAGASYATQPGPEVVKASGTAYNPMSED